MSDTSSFKLIIEDDEGRRSVVPIDLDSVREGISIGRQEGNTIRLNERNVSRRHARFVREQVGIYAEDLDSYNGVWINGDRIKGRQELHDGDTVRVGDFQLELRGEGLQRRVEETTQRTIVNEGSEVTRPDIRLEHAMNGGPLSPSTPLPPLQPAAPMGAPPLAASVGNGAMQAETHGQSRVDFQSRIPTIDDDVQRPEPTALIRMDHVEAVESARKRDAQTVSGQKAKLVCVSTQFAGAEYDIDKTEVVIGRTEENDIPIDHRSVSRHHAKIVVNQRSYRIMDLKSANGTLVNGEEYAQTELKRGDLIELGHVKFRFLPPGAAYDFTADELQAMRAANGAGQASAQQVRISGLINKGVTQVLSLEHDLGNISAQPTAINQWSEELEKINSKKRMKPVIVAGASAIVVVLIGALVLWVVSTRNQPQMPRNYKDITAADPASQQAQPVPAGNPQDLLARGNAAMAQRQWTEARKLADALLVMQPNDAQGLDLQRRATDEMIGQAALDRAVASLNSRNWDDAWRQLGEVPDNTAAHSQAASLREQVRAGRIIAKIDEAKRKIAAGQIAEARSAVSEVAEMDPSSPELPGLRSAVEDAASGHSAPLTAEPKDRPEKTPRQQAPKTPKQPTQPQLPQQTTAPTPPTQNTTKPTLPPPMPPATPAVDSKTYYAQGLQALQQQDTEKAIELLDKCVKADTKNGMCYRALGIAYARLKNGPKAAKYYRMYLRVMPDAKDAKQVEELLKAYEGASAP